MSAALQPSLSSAADLDPGADQAIAASGGDGRVAVKALLVVNADRKLTPIGVVGTPSGP